MVACVCAPLIERNIDRARSLGVQILGCCGDANHTYGFHVPAGNLPASDYSRVRSGRPVSMSYACAGDFGMNQPWSRRWLAWLVASVQAGRFPEVVEIIGSLDGKGALYWARWNGWAVERYTGAGHVSWSHVSCDRAFADRTVDVFAGWPSSPAPVQAVPRLLSLKKTWMVGDDVRVVQRKLGIAVDGVFGPQTDRAVRAFQRSHGLTVDGVVGPNTRRALGV